MKMQLRQLAVLTLAMGFLAAPALGAGAVDTCPPCCPQPAEAPCETGEAPCESLAALSCCGVGPATPTSEAKRSTDAPSFHPRATAPRPGASAPPPAARPSADGDLALLTSPLRLSVVLRI